MLQKTYSIYSENLDKGQLFIEAGKNHIACWCRDHEQNKLTAFELFQFEAYTGASVHDIINDTKAHSKLLSAQEEAPGVILNTDEAICIPLNTACSDDDFIKQNLNLLFGPAEANICTEKYREYLLASRINTDLHDSVQSSFPGVQFHSQYACLLRGLMAHEMAEIVYLFFYPYYFSLIAFKEGNLQILQTKAYNAPEDVLYFVLNVFKQYNISRGIEILTGGFIDEQSKLYQTLYQYLGGLKPAEVDKALFAGGEFKDYSLHYFLPYANYVL